MLRFGASRLVVINNHLTSKGADDRLLGSVQPPVRHSEAQRVAQARLIRELVDTLLAEGSLAGVVVLGDLNELEHRPPVVELESSGSLTDLIRQVPAPERYTYVYQGSSQVLDHILVSPGLADGAEVDVVHVDADVPANGRASDHDPVICRLAVPGAARR
jgi:predicted extracellular nuclease